MGLLQDAGGAISDGWKSLGGGVAELNPFRDKVSRPDLDPYQVNEDAFLDTGAHDALKTQMAYAMGEMNKRTDPTMQAAMIDPTQQAEIRKRQINLANALQQQAAGQGPSLASAQLQDATNRGMQQAMGMAASQKGLSAGQRARMALNSAAQVQRDAGMNAAQTRMQEQLNAQNALASVLAGARGQDMSLASNQAQLAQGANQANLQAALASRAQGDAAKANLFGQMTGIADTNKQSAMALEQLKSGNQNALIGAETGMYGSDKASQSQQQGAIIGGLGAIGSGFLMGKK